MLPAGDNSKRIWTEGGAWWKHEPAIEVHYSRQKNGKKTEEIIELETPWLAGIQPTGELIHHNEEVSLRPRKIRDEKVSLAGGKIQSFNYQIVQNMNVQDYVPLDVMSAYSFGRSLLFASESPRLATQMGFTAIALTDWFSLAGAFEHYNECKKCGIKPLIGASFELETGGEITLIAKSKRGYTSLSRIISECHLSHERKYPSLSWKVLEEHASECLCLQNGTRSVIQRYLINRSNNKVNELFNKLLNIFGAHQIFLSDERALYPWQIDLSRRVKEISEVFGVRRYATIPARMSSLEQFPGLDVLACMDQLSTVDEIVGRKTQGRPLTEAITRLPMRPLNHELYLADFEQVLQRFSDEPELIFNTKMIAQLCDDDVMPARCRLPKFVYNPDKELQEKVLRGAKSKYPAISSGLKRRIDFETERIQRLGYSDIFLCIADACEYAKCQGIHFSGRGSVVDSVVAYCLGLSRIDAYEHNLHFDRFLPDDGTKRPDIDIDFEAKKRDEIRNYFIKKYGKNHVATVCAFGAMCTRGIIREVGKALGMPDSLIGFLAKKVHSSTSPDQIYAAMVKRPELKKLDFPKQRLEWVFKLAPMLADIPRDIRAHSSGVIISENPICDTVPVQWSASTMRTVESSEKIEENLRIIQWDKRSAKYCFDKYDILCLRGQDVISGAEKILIKSKKIEENHEIDINDPEIYRAMRSGELIGIPQSASPAMRQAHVRLKTDNLADASLVQAGIRPGVGGAVKMNALISRRRGLEPYTFEHPELEEILGNTYGIIVFQEQVDQLLQAFCKYSSGEAEEIRDKIHKKRREDYAQLIKEEMLAKMQKNGYSTKVAEQVFEYVSGFRGYGFAQGHALAFAEISVRSIYLQQNFPAEYFASLLNAQPAGYYGPATLCNEARNRGIIVLPPCVQNSKVEFTAETVRSTEDPKLELPNGGIRVGFQQIEGLNKKNIEKIERNGPYEDINEFAAKNELGKDEYWKLIMCGALDCFSTNRRALLWAIPELCEARKNSGFIQHKIILNSSSCENFNFVEKAIAERRTLGLDVEQHLMAFERSYIQNKNGKNSSEIKRLIPGAKAMIVGNPIRLRFPPTPSGKRVVFFDLEDEFGLLNVTCFDRTYQLDGHAIICSPYVTVIGHVQDRDGFPAFLASRVFPYRPLRTLELLKTSEIPIKGADFLVG